MLGKIVQTHAQHFKLDRRECLHHRLSSVNSRPSANLSTGHSDDRRVTGKTLEFLAYHLSSRERAGCRVADPACQAPAASLCEQSRATDEMPGPGHGVREPLIVFYRTQAGFCKTSGRPVDSHASLLSYTTDRVRFLQNRAATGVTSTRVPSIRHSRPRAPAGARSD